MSDTKTFTVGELNRLIRHALALTFPDEVWVEGEISSLKRHESSGHVYFQLVESGRGAPQADATLSVVLYRANKETVNRLLKRSNPLGTVRMADGVHVRLRGSLDYYPPQGRLQLRMMSIDPAYTLGRLAAERDRVLAALATEGLLARNAALAFPLLPLRVGLVTSDGSAAHADFLEELRLSGLGWRITLIQARVQGPGADHEVAGALRHLDRLGLDLVALVRGGGARSDLMTFDAEVIARTIAAMRTPVLTGIGHEIDTSVADAVAARSYKTPTACAGAMVEHARQAIARSELAWDGIARQGAGILDAHERQLVGTGHRVAAATRGRLDVSLRLVDHAGARADRAARAALGLADHRLDTLAARTTRAARAALGLAGHRLDTVAARASAVDPQRALARGWSITRTADGRVVRDAGTVRPGDRLLTTVASGHIASIVDAAPAASDDGADPEPVQGT